MSSLHSKSSTKAAGVPLYRRLLFPDLPLAVAPPPILPRASPELNAELYEFIALALRAYITPWWSKITRYDSEFIPHVASVIVEVIRVLVSRLEAVDISQLVYGAVPTVIEQHYADYHAASSKVGSAYASGGAETLEMLFHHHQSHMGIDADGNIDATYIRHLLDLILQACLPMEDQESDAERTIIREVIAKVILKDVVPMLSQPWFIHKQMLDQLRSGRRDAVASSTKEAEPPQKRSSNLSFHSAVIFVLSTVQYLSGLCLALINWYKQALGLVKHVHAAPKLPKTKHPREFSFNLARCVSEVLNVKTRATATVVFNIVESILKNIEDFADKFLVYMLHAHVMTEQRVITIVKLSKQNLFPNGYPGPPPVFPPPEEQAIIKEELIRQIEMQIPSFISSIVLGTGQSSRKTIEDALEPLSSAACNVHLVLFLLDLIVLTLFPEFGVQASAEDEVGSSKEGSRTTSSPEPEGEVRAMSSRTTSSTEGRGDPEC